MSDPTLRARQGLRAAFALALVVVTALALWPLDQPLPLDTGWDKSNHLLAFGMLCLLGLAGWPRHRWHVLAGLLLYGALIELLQGLTGYRQADWRDFAADGLGMALGWALRAAALSAAARLRSRRRPAAPHPPRTSAPAGEPRSARGSSPGSGR